MISNTMLKAACDYHVGMYKKAEDKNTLTENKRKELLKKFDRDMAEKMADTVAKDLDQHVVRPTDPHEQTTHYRARKKFYNWVNNTGKGLEQMFVDPFKGHTRDTWKHLYPAYFYESYHNGPRMLANGTINAVAMPAHLANLVGFISGRDKSLVEVPQVPYKVSRWSPNERADNAVRDVASDTWSSVVLPILGTKTGPFGRIWGGEASKLDPVVDTVVNTAVVPSNVPTDDQNQGTSNPSSNYDDVSMKRLYNQIESQGVPVR